MYPGYAKLTLISEDCWALVQRLPDFNSPVSTEELVGAFGAVAATRQPKTTAVVKAARAAGENRVVRGGEGDVEGRRKRDDVVRASWQDVGTLRAIWDGFYQGPFEDLGGYSKVQIEGKTLKV